MNKNLEMTDLLWSEVHLRLPFRLIPFRFCHKAKAEDISTMIKRRTREQKFHFFQSRPMASLPKKKIQKKFALSGGGNGVLNIFPKFLRDFVLRNFVRFFSHCSIFHAK